MQLLGALFAWWHFCIWSLSSRNTDAFVCSSRPRFVLGVERRVSITVIVFLILGFSHFISCQEQATLKGEFSNKALTETVVLKVELPCGFF